ncbi:MULTISPECIES: hypothetical protein [Grimontia]|nr:MULTISPECIES: hypothetical protein [Grimontia]
MTITLPCFIIREIEHQQIVLGWRFTHLSAPMMGKFEVIVVRAVTNDRTIETVVVFKVTQISKVKRSLKVRPSTQIGQRCD